MPPGPAFRNKPAGSAASLPPEGSSAVFGRLVALLRSSPPISGWTVRAWDDPAQDASPPSSDGPPWLRLTPRPGPSELYARGPEGVVHRMPLLVEFELSTPGTLVGHSQRAWGAVLGALFPPAAWGSGPSPALSDLGVSRIEVHQPAWGAPPIGPDGSPGERCEGRGLVEFTMYFATPE